MNTSIRLCRGLLVATLSLNSLSVLADTNRVCQLNGPYGYIYNGTSYTLTGPVPLTETGVLTVDNSGNLSGVGILAFQFSNFNGQGPLWLLIREVQSNGVVTRDTTNPCTGVANFVATGTVISTSNSAMVPEGTVLFSNSPRSIAYTITGLKYQIVDLISTSPGTIASGVAHKQGTNR